MVHWLGYLSSVNSVSQSMCQSVSQSIQTNLYVSLLVPRCLSVTCSVPPFSSCWVSPASGTGSLCLHRQWREIGETPKLWSSLPVSLLSPTTYCRPGVNKSESQVFWRFFLIEKLNFIHNTSLGSNPASMRVAKLYKDHIVQLVQLRHPHTEQ